MDIALLRLGLNSEVPWTWRTGSFGFIPSNFFIVDLLRAMSTSSTISSEHQPARSRARKLVEEIAKEHGFLDESVYATMSPETQRRVKEAMFKKDNLIGSSAVTYDDTIVAMWTSC